MEQYRKDPANKHPLLAKFDHAVTDKAIDALGMGPGPEEQNPSGLNDAQIRTLADKQPKAVGREYHTLWGGTVVEGNTEPMTPETIKAVDAAASKPPQAGAVNADKVTKATTGKPTILHHDSTQSRPFRGAGPSQ